MDPTTGAVLIAAIAGLPPTLMGLASFLQSRRGAASLQKAQEANTATTADTNEKVDALGGKSDDLKVKTEEIHVLVNGNLTKAQEQLVSANAHIASQQALIDLLQAARQPLPDLPPIATPEKTQP